MAKKSFQERFQEDYTAVIVPCDNKDGFRIEYVYYSPWYVWDSSDGSLPKRKRGMLLNGILILALYVLTAAYPSVLNSLALVAFPALFSLIMLVFLAFSLGLFCYAKEKATRFVFRYVDRGMRIAPVLAGFLAVCASLGGIYYAVFYGFSIDMAVLIIGYGLIAGLCFRIYNAYRSLSFHTEKNDILKHYERASLD